MSARGESNQPYDSLYEEFDSPLMRRVRSEAYAEDIGQHSWVTARELVERNPCDGLKRPRKERPRERVLSADELGILWAALEATEERKGEEAPGRLAPETVAAAVRLLVLLGTRRGETLRMRWQDVDLKVGEWRIPGEFRKGGDGLTVPLSLQAKAILLPLQAKAGTQPWVFAGERGASIASNPGRIGATLRVAVQKTVARLNMKVKARKAHVKVEPFTLHDLRRTCATGCGDLGAPPHVVALILGHQTMPGAGRVTAVYDRAKRVHEVAPWLARWGDQVERLVTAARGTGELLTFQRS